MVGYLCKPVSYMDMSCPVMIEVEMESIIFVSQSFEVGIPQSAILISCS